MRVNRERSFQTRPPTVSVFAWDRLLMSFAFACFVAAVVAMVYLHNHGDVRRQVDRERERLEADRERIRLERIEIEEEEARQREAHQRVEREQREYLEKLQRELQETLQEKQRLDDEKRRTEEELKKMMIEKNKKEDQEADLAHELEAERQQKLWHAEMAKEYQGAATAGGKALGGVLLCTVLWDMTAWIGNPLAVPGLVDNAVCGGLFAAGHMVMGGGSEERVEPEGEDRRGKLLGIDTHAKVRTWWDKVGDKFRR